VRQVLLSPRWLARHALALVLVAACLRLGWWQWERAGAAGGNVQNLAYALQWPLFAGFVVFAWWRMLRYELRPPTPEPAPPTETAPDGRRTVEVRRRYAPPVPEDEPDEQLAAYNRYLARLNARAGEDARTGRDARLGPGAQDGPAGPNAQVDHQRP
jgi:hypothetical protein